MSKELKTLIVALALGTGCVGGVNDPSAVAFDAEIERPSAHNQFERGPTILINEFRDPPKEGEPAEETLDCFDISEMSNGNTNYESHMRRIYDDRGNVVETIEWVDTDVDGEPNVIVRSRYDLEHRLLESTTHRTDGSASRLERRYNDAGEMSEQTIYVPSGGREKVRQRQVFSSPGNLLVDYLDDDVDGTPEKDIEAHIDDEGRIVRVVNNLTGRVVSETEYDLDALADFATLPSPARTAVRYDKRTEYLPRSVPRVTGTFYDEAGNVVAVLRNIFQSGSELFENYHVLVDARFDEENRPTYRAEYSLQNLREGTIGSWTYSEDNGTLRSEYVEQNIDEETTKVVLTEAVEFQTVESTDADADGFFEQIITTSIDEEEDATIVLTEVFAPQGEGRRLVERIRTVNGELDEHLEYSEAGNLAIAEYGSGITEHYDERGRLVHREDRSDDVRHVFTDYDSQGRITAEHISTWTDTPVDGRQVIETTDLVDGRPQTTLTKTYDANGLSYYETEGYLFEVEPAVCRYDEE